MIYIVGCGQKKLKVMSYAKNMYIGPIFKKAYAYASLRTPDYKIFIISAKFGLIEPKKMIMPYNEKIGKNETITIDQVIDQATRFGIIDKEITILAGKSYCDFLSKVFKNKIDCPLNGLKLGYSEQFLSKGIK